MGMMTKTELAVRTVVNGELHLGGVMEVPLDVPLAKLCCDDPLDILHVRLSLEDAFDIRIPLEHDEKTLKQIIEWLEGGAA